MTSENWHRLVWGSVLLAASILTLNLFTASTYEGENRENMKEAFQNDYRIYALSHPESLTFAGEEVPLQLIDVSEKFDREFLVNTYWQSQTLLLIKRSNRWFPLIEQVLKEEGVPDDFKYLALIESGLTNVVSPAGATGFWQLMKDAAEERGLEINSQVDERYHMEKATRAACNYLKEAKAKFGNWTLAAASYNMGMAGLNKQLDRQKATNYYDLVLNEETSRYVFRIVAAKLILENPSAFGFQFTEEDLYKPLKFDTLVIDSSVNNLADFAFQHGTNYKALKFLNPWLRDNQLENPKGKKYIIQIPTEPLSADLVYDKAQVANFARSRQENE